MSLQLAAQHLASKGRGPDRMLVHMTPGEVQSLQAVAMAHGGSLTVNPDTGLPEAGFLSSILPMIAGVGLTAISGGTLSPLMAGLLTGGGTALATGNLRKGLMAGIGAYGGAGLGAGLAGAGAAGANTAATNSILQANPGLTAGEIGREMGTAGFVQPQIAANMNPATMSMTDKMMAGVKGLGNEAGRSAAMQQLGGAKGLMRYGAAAMSPALMAQSGESAERPSTGAPYQFEFNAGATGAGPSRDTGETRYFAPRLRRMADGGSTGMTGESDAYYRYLMGLAPAPTPATYAPPASYTPGGSSATSISEALAPSAQLMAGNKGPYYNGEPGPSAPDPNNNWSELTPLEQAQFYSMNPGKAATTSFLQNMFGFTTPGMIQNYFVPGFVSEQKSIPNGQMLAQYMQQYDHFGNLLTPGLAPVETAVPTISNQQAAQQAADEFNASLAASSAGIGASNVPGGSNFGADLGYDDPNEGDTAGPTGADNEDAGMGDAIAAANAAAVDAGMSAVAESSGNPDSAPSDGGSGPSSAGEYAYGGLTAFAQGGYNLGDYSDGGRLLRGPGDGVSDSIPASIGNKRPARLADGEFVIPARIVSELGNGSTEAGARKLYAMMDRVQSNRSKTTGRGKVAVNSRSEKYLPA